MRFSLLLVVLAALGAQTLATVDDADSCYSFAGGSVYPAEAPKGDHTLQTTKAVSKFKFIKINKMILN